MSHLAAAPQLNAPRYLGIKQLLDDWAKRAPDAPAILAPGCAPLTYARLHKQVDEVAQTLRTRGLGRHDRVALVLSNGPEMAVACLAVAAGMACAPLNPAYNSNEFSFQLKALRPKALLIQSGMDSSARAAARALNISVIEVQGMSEGPAGLFTLMCQGGTPAAPCEWATADDIALLLPTGGTTSRPKMVPLTHRNICTAAHNLHMALELASTDRCLNVLPLFHVHALLTALLVSLVAGASVVCAPDFEVGQFFVWLETFCPTWYTAVPTIHEAILARAPVYHEIITRCPLRLIRVGSAALSPVVRTELERVFKARVIETYGMTEASGHITCNPPPHGQWKTGSAGAVVGPEVTIMDEDGTLLPPGQTGEIVVRGATVMQGYANDPGSNQQAFRRGWFRSGDQGHLDAEGYLFVTGRLKEIINRGGENIAPQEVEEALLAHPAVAEAVAFAVPHPRLGEDIAAAVVLHRNASGTAQDLRLFAAQRLIDSKVPRWVYIVKELPRTQTGKLQRVGFAERLGLMGSGRGQPERGAGYRAPRTPTEEVLAALWAQVFGLERVGIDDDFFRLGGDSLVAMQLLARIRDTWRVDLSFRGFFEAPTVGGMATCLQAADQDVLDPPDTPLQPVSRDGPHPLSFAQQRLWFLEQLDPSRAVYNLPLAWRFNGHLDIAALERSLGEMVRRHEILRTSFPSVDGEPVQMIRPDLMVSLPVTDLQALPAINREAAVQRLATQEARRPFDMAHGPLIRAMVLRVSGQDHVLLVTMHHIIFDAWSLEVFWQELVTIYTAMCAGRLASLPPLPLQYADFAVWQRQRLQGEMLEAHLAYWEHQLGDPLPALQLPTDRPRPPSQTFRGGRQSVVFDASLTTALKTLSRRQGVTLFMTLVAAFKTLLFRYTGQTDLVVGTPVAGRTRVETEGLLGFFVNTLVLRTDLSGNPRFCELLRRVREVTLAAYDHQDLPFEKLVEALHPVRDLSRNPVVQVMVAPQPPPPRLEDLLGLTVRQLPVDPGTAKFELTLCVQDTEQGLSATVEFNSDLFEHSTITRIMGHFQTLLEGILADPDQRLADLPLLTTAERQQLLSGWNTSMADHPQDACVHALFEVQVERTPNAVAVVFDGQQLTYFALNQRANQLAHHLRALGVGPEVCVGLCVQRSIEMVVGILGILKAGGAYVPLETDFPAERLATMMADAQIAVLVVQQQCAAALPAPGVPVVCLDKHWGRIAQQSVANPVGEVTPANLVYVMYTSGSTGAPKGIMIEHRQVIGFLYGFEHVAPAGAECVGATVCPFGFDVSGWECFSILCFGGTLHVLPLEIAMVPEQFARYLVAQGITSTYMPPALVSDIAEHLEQQSASTALSRLLVGVEPIQQGTLQRFRNLSEQMHIVNGYGPTETTVCATLHPFCAAIEPDRRAPIGSSIRGYEVYLVDAHLQPVPLGIPGELLIGGVGLARGYINHPEFTAERFIPHPFSVVPGARLYKTGDWARYLPDGNLEFLGRGDHQVKIHGYRIELQEIEAALCQHPAVLETVVFAREDVQCGDKHLVAYLVSSQKPPPTPRALRTFLTQKLPAYMVPPVFMVLETFPRTVNGKVDRQALPLPDLTPSPSAATFVAPRTPTESTLAGIWTDVLGLERVGVHDNFFELGGDSIRGIQIVARANRAGFGLIPKDLFQHQTIAELAAVTGSQPAIQRQQHLVTEPIPAIPTQHGCFGGGRAEEQSEHLEAIYPLSPMQQGMLFHTVYASTPGVYHAQWSGTLQGHLHVSAFRQAWQSVMDRHPALRTAFHWQSSRAPFQVVHRRVELLWRQHDWQGMSAIEQERQIAAFLREDRTQGFELSKAPLMRLTLLQLAEDVYQCIWSLHHLLLDAWSLPLVLPEVLQFYEAFQVGREIHLQVSRPYGDYIAWLQQQDLSQAEAFWRQTLKGFINPTVLNVRPEHGSTSGKESCDDEQQMRLSAVTTAALQDLAQQHHLSVNTLMQGAWAILVSRYSGQEDVMFGATVAGRPAELAGIESMVGLLINTLPVRVQVARDAWLIPWLQTLQSQQAEARQYDYSPLVQIHGWSEVPRGLPLFETLIVFENYPARTALQAWSGSLKIHQARFISSTHYPLTIVVVPDSALSLRIKYHCDRFDTATINRMLGQLQTLLEGMVANPTRRLEELPIFSQAERHQVLVEWNDTSTSSPQDTCIHQLFEAQVARTPDAVAVVFEEQELTYQEVNVRANQLAYYLRALGVGPEVLVGMCIERSLDMVVALLGVLKAGGAYVPLDSASPQERLAFILRDASVSVLLTQRRLSTGLTAPQTHVVCLDTDWQLIAQNNTTNPINQAAPDNLVYVVYTSGSTGRPKGVAVEHRQLGNYLHGVLKRLELPNAASFATVSSLATDLGNTIVFTSLCTGGCLHVLSQERVTDPDAMADYFTRHSIECLKIVPSHLKALHRTLQPNSILPRRLLILGGEASPSDWVESLQRFAPGCTILNHYGPTETTIGVLTYRVEEHQRPPITSPLPLGRPLANVQLYLLDQHLQPVPLGVQGELYIGGANLARGYLNQPTLTAEKFIPHPFSDKPGARLYKTGDLARYLPDGNLEFLGRLDYQVKMRGYRIELREVETTLEYHPAIQQAVVLMQEDPSGDRRLVAYCVPPQGCRPDARELRRFLQTQLPTYMVPAAFVILSALPLTLHGKVDRQALPTLDHARPPLIEACVAPHTPFEEIVVGIWASVLGVESVGIHDNFFALGGHSLLAMQVISRLRTILQVDVPLRTLFDAPTVAGLARWVAMARQASPHVTAPALTATTREGVLPLTMTQEHLWGLDRLLPGAPFSNVPHAVRVNGPLDVTALAQSLNDIITRHEVLRTTFTTVAGQPVQIIAQTLHVPLPVEDLCALPQAEREATAHRLAQAAALHPFDLEKGPLLNLRLLRIGEQEHMLLLIIHHIISDGWSREILLDELVALYEAFCQGKPSPLPDLPIQFADYAHWQCRRLHSEAGKARLAYWTQQLRDPLPRLELPTDRPRTGELSLRTARQSFQLPKVLCAALARFSRQEGTTLYMTLVAAFKTLLYTRTGQEDIRVGTLVANRPHQEIEGLIGLFVNLVILRTSLSGDLTVRQILQKVRTTILDAYAHQDIPFEYLVRTLVQERHIDRLSLFQVMFDLQPAQRQLRASSGLTFVDLEMQAIDATPCELVVSLRRNADGLKGVCLYKTALFEESTIARMLGDFEKMLGCFIAQPQQSVLTLLALQQFQDC